jgi:hypothetical protein
MFLLDDPTTRLRILQPLVARKNLPPAAGEAGKLRVRGPFPASLSVTFDA